MVKVSRHTFFQYVLTWESQNHRSVLLQMKKITCANPFSMRRIGDLEAIGGHFFFWFPRQIVPQNRSSVGKDEKIHVCQTYIIRDMGGLRAIGGPFYFFFFIELSGRKCHESANNCSHLYIDGTPYMHSPLHMIPRSPPPFFFCVVIDQLVCFPLCFQSPYTTTRWGRIVWETSLHHSDLLLVMQTFLLFVLCFLSTLRHSPLILSTPVGFPPHPKEDSAALWASAEPHCRARSS